MSGGNNIGGEGLGVGTDPGGGSFGTEINGGTGSGSGMNKPGGVGSQSGIAGQNGLAGQADQM